MKVVTLFYINNIFNDICFEMFPLQWLLIILIGKSIQLL